MLSAPSVRRIRAALVGVGLAVALAGPASATHPFKTASGPMMTASPGVALTPIITVGESYHGVMFEGIPDGLGLMPGAAPGTVDVLVNHEQSRVPFQGLADFVDASVSRWALDPDGDVVGASIPLRPELGFVRLSSATMAGPAEGLDRYLFFTGEESDDDLAVPAGAPYGPDPALAPLREAGYAIALDPATGIERAIGGMGRHNHENSMVIPGGWNQIAVLSGDDTFNPPASRLYMYLANGERQLLRDRGALWAFRVTRTEEGPVDPTDPFNEANDYGDLATGEEFRGRFVRVPKEIARGLTSGKAPQKALEDWSNGNNVFQFIRVEDTAYDPRDPRVVYVADTGATRVFPDPATGRLERVASSPAPIPPSGLYPNGRIFRMEFDEHDPRKVTSFTTLLDADSGGPSPGVLTMQNPDNLGTSANSLMVQEDSGRTPNSRVWRYDFAAETWSVVASVLDPDWESSGIVDASSFFGPGAWLVDVQAHDVFVGPTQTVGAVTSKREGGQLLLMVVPGS